MLRILIIVPTFEHYQSRYSPSTFDTNGFETLPPTRNSEPDPTNSKCYKRKVFVIGVSFRGPGLYDFFSHLTGMLSSFFLFFFFIPETPCTDRGDKGGEFWSSALNGAQEEANWKRCPLETQSGRDFLRALFQDVHSRKEFDVDIRPYASVRAAAKPRSTPVVCIARKKGQITGPRFSRSVGISNSDVLYQSKSSHNVWSVTVVFS